MACFPLFYVFVLSSSLVSLILLSDRDLFLRRSRRFHLRLCCPRNWCPSKNDSEIASIFAGKSYEASALNSREYVTLGTVLWCPALFLSRGRTGSGGATFAKGWKCETKYHMWCLIESVRSKLPSVPGVLCKHVLPWNFRIDLHKCPGKTVQVRKHTWTKASTNNQNKR